ncbi:hypothetical protein OROMI_010060 [Orobanche minor]
MTNEVVAACDTMLEKALVRLRNHGELPNKHQDLLEISNSKRELLDIYAKNMGEFSHGDDGDPSYIWSESSE